MQAFRRARDVALFNGGNKTTKLSEIHSLSRINVAGSRMKHPYDGGNVEPDKEEMAAGISKSSRSQMKTVLDSVATLISNSVSQS
ncbi:hypothetical protein BOTU111921_18000 [Bordetella tumbae]